MTDITAPDILLNEVLARYSDSPNPRMKQVMESFIRHIHAFARDIELQREEWLEGIKWLTATGKICSETRQEFILLSDTIGLSMLVEIMAESGEGVTEATVLGPFFAPDSPERAKGESMLLDPDDGDLVVVRGRVTDVDGNPIANAVLDCWQSNTAGWYAVQQHPSSSTNNLRGIYRTDENGEYEIRSVRPGPYPIPSDGPVGDLLKANNRGWMRPGHLHVWLHADGFKELITHLFDSTSSHIEDDAVFGVRESLIVEFTPDATGELEAIYNFALDKA